MHKKVAHMHFLVIFAMVIIGYNAKSENTHLKYSPARGCTFLAVNSVMADDNPSSTGLAFAMRKTAQSELEKCKNLNEKFGIKEISKMVGICCETIRKYFKVINYKWNTHQKFPNKKYDESDIRKIHMEYMEDKNISAEVMAIQYNITRDCLCNNFKKYGLCIKSRDTVTCNYNINHDFFSKIDSEIKAYLLGFFAADGHIENRRKSHRLSIPISIRDVEIVKLFNKYIANNSCKILYKKSNDVCVGCSIRISSRQIGKDLKKWGYDNRKTYTCKSIPNIPKNMMRHFIRGYFDGDGSISICKNKHRKKSYKTHFQILCYNKNVLVDISNKLSHFKKEKMHFYETKKVTRCIQGVKTVCNPIHVFLICSTPSIKMMYKYLYKNAHFYLKRKERKFRKIYTI